MDISTDDPRLIAFARLLKIMDELREKCPWDMKQTMQTLRPLTIEETYELAEAIDQGDLNEVKNELGDVMLHIVFYAKLGEEQGAFDIADVLNTQCEKLIFRHPHIYDDTVVENEEDVKRNWEALKLKGGAKSVLGGVPKGLPSLIKAYRIQEKASKSGFDWPSSAEVLDKVQEEILELKQAVASGSQLDKEAELGDVLFSLVNYARFIGVEPDTALEKTNQKFIRRFTYVEDQVRNSGKALANATLADMDHYWNQAKAQERQTPQQS